MRAAIANALAAMWNQQYLVGHPVLYVRGEGPGAHVVRTVTTSGAFVGESAPFANDHWPVVMLQGVARPVLLSHLVPINEGEWSAIVNVEPAAALAVTA